MSKPLVFFLSPGRSGTQWIADRLAANYADLAEVTHEPIAYEYRPKFTLRNPNFSPLIIEVDRLRAHLEHIEAISVSQKIYIEVGWPVFSWIPYFINRYGQRVRLIHLTRHPIYFSYSLQSHGFYNKSIIDNGYIRYTQLEPYDLGIFHKEYKEKWGQSTSFEKCLFQWIEVNEYALELKRSFPAVPFLHIRMEDLVGSHEQVWQEMTNFIGLPHERVIKDSMLQQRVDRFPFKMDKIVNPKKIHEHPSAIRLAKEFGYDVENINKQAINLRYKRSIPRLAARALIRRLSVQQLFGKYDPRLWPIRLPAGGH